MPDGVGRPEEMLPSIMRLVNDPVPWSHMQKSQMPSKELNVM